jgi:protein SCO1
MECSTNRKLNVFITLLLLLLLTFSNVLLANTKNSDSRALVDQYDKPFQFEQLLGNVVLVFFGYTSCPDVCPLEVSTMARVLKPFEAQHAKVRGVFVSVDGERDTPEVLRRYLNFFHANITGVTGDKKHIDQLARQFFVSYSVNRQANGKIEVTHSSNLYVLDQQGVLSALVPFGMGEEQISSLVQGLINQNETNEETQ